MKETHILAGFSTPYVAWGNDMADKAAERAHCMVSDCEHLCSVFKAKQEIYIDFLHGLWGMFLRVIRAEKKLRDQRAKALPKALPLKLPHREIHLLQSRTIALPHSPQIHEGVSLPPRLHSSVVNCMVSHDRCVFNFLCNTHWVLPGVCNSLGSSWLELVLAYACAGGTLACADTLLKVPSIHQAIKEFRTRAKRLVQLAFPPEYQNCFGPYGISFVRLSGLGIATLMPGIQGKLCLSDSMRDHICEIVVGIAHNMKLSRVKAAMRGDLRVFPTRFPLRRRTDAFHLTAHSEFQHLCSNLVGSAFAVASAQPRPIYFRIQCPKCASATVDVANRKLYGANGWAALSCPRCGRSTTAKSWKCTCGKA